MRIRAALGAVVAVLLIAGAAQWIASDRRVKREDRGEAARIEGIGAAAVHAHVTTFNCGEKTGCDCKIAPDEVFSGCRMMEGHIVLMVRSVDECFLQWAVVNRTWDTVSSPMYLGATWMSRLPRKVAPTWSLVALAPCVD